MTKQPGQKLIGNPANWTIDDKKRYEVLCEILAFIEEKLQDIGFYVEGHTLAFEGDTMTYRVNFGGLTPTTEP